MARSSSAPGKADGVSVRKDQVSSTALLIAAAMVLLRQDAETSALVSPTTAELGERVLGSYSLATKGLRWSIQQRAISPLAEWIERLTIPGILRHYALRKKCLADLARAALDRGASQTVVLGAGFDGCALELAREYRQARFWEIDHTATQRWKARILGENGSAHVELIPADLSQAALPAKALFATHFDPEASTFWIAEGILMYLPEKVVQALIGAIQSLTTTGAIAFSFMEKRNDGCIRFRRQSQLVDRWLSRSREPFLWSASRSEVTALFPSWDDVTFFDHHDLRALGRLERAVPLAAGETICLATR